MENKPIYSIDSLRVSVAIALAKPDRKYFSLTAKQGAELISAIEALRANAAQK